MHQKVALYRVWLKDNGVHLPAHVDIAPVDWGYGLIYNPPTQEQDPTSERSSKRQKTGPSFFNIKVPHKLILHPFYQPDIKFLEDRLNKNISKWKRLIKKQVLRVDLDLLATYWYLIIQKRLPDSQWKPYLDILPDYLDTPLHWTPEELQLIEGTNLFQGTMQIKEMLQNIQTFISRLDPEVTLSDVYWAYSCFSSRVFGINKLDNSEDYSTAPESQNVIPCLVPLVDAMNHHTGTKVKYITNNQANEFHYETEYDPSLGNEVFNNYGSKSNEAFILSYGFEEEGNLNNEYWFKVALSKDDSLFPQKESLLESQHLSLRHHIKNDDFPNEILQTMRILLLNEEELFLYSPGASSDYVSIRNSFLLFQTLTDLLRSRRAKLPNPNVDYEGNYRKKLAFNYVSSQKSILDFAIKLLKQKKNDLISSLPPARSEIPILKFIASSPAHFKNAKQWIETITEKSAECVIEDGELVQLIQPHFHIKSEYVIGPQSESLVQFFSSFKFDGEIPEDTKICLFLINEKHAGVKSQWFQFFETLPSPFPSLSDFFNHLDVIQSLPLFDYVKDMQDQIKEQTIMILKRLNKTLPQLFPENIFSPSAFTWAFSVLLQFSHQIENSGITFVPIYPPTYNPSIFTKWSLKNNSFSCLHYKKQKKYQSNYDFEPVEQLLCMGVFLEPPSLKLQLELPESDDSESEYLLEYFLRKNIYPSKVLQLIKEASKSNSEDDEAEPVDPKQVLSSLLSNLSSSLSIPTGTPLLDSYFEAISSILSDNRNYLI